MSNKTQNENEVEVKIEQILDIDNDYAHPQEQLNIQISHVDGDGDGKTQGKGGWLWGRLNIVYGSSRGHKLVDSIIGTATTATTTTAACHVESSFSRKFFVFFWYICRASFWFYGQRAWGMNNGRILSKSFTTFAKVLNSTQTTFVTLFRTHAHKYTHTNTHPQWDHTLHNRIGNWHLWMPGCPRWQLPKGNWKVRKAEIAANLRLWPCNKLRRVQCACNALRDARVAATSA